MLFQQRASLYSTCFLAVICTSQDNEAVMKTNGVTNFGCDGMFDDLLYCIFSGECASENSFENDQYLVKL